MNPIVSTLRLLPTGCYPRKIGTYRDVHGTSEGGEIDATSGKSGMSTKLVEDDPGGAFCPFSNW